MAIARDAPYIWVTWISSLLAGGNHCEWATWFRAHFQDYDRRPSNFDQATWRAQHGEMVRTRAAGLRAQGYDVYIEDQNRFSYRGRAATLGGKPGLVAVRETEALVVDCKTGKQRDSDYFQVLTYMLLLPRTHSACHHRTLAGEIQYRGSSLFIEPQELTSELKLLIRTMIERVAGDTILPRVPSFYECRFCELGRKDCPERIYSEPLSQLPEHELF